MALSRYNVRSNRVSDDNFELDKAKSADFIKKNVTENNQLFLQKNL